ncbi:ATP-binding protein [Dissulfurimicrobium hydrothermale]|uniref:ATP-binding protein n=1 Tax=Dissulfurimicrobium hydrothermale TaxID=1750598 RepID=UPI001EDB78E6|nr:AAA family ATPase [Dissulfurimicrobium hydrothermale]UKL14251.1 AAA family ATPase [Dissulfurimicrobium hydrothermale]
MRIAGFHIDGFGIFHNVHVKDMPGGLVLFHGENEAGKTTLLAFLRAVLFGFPRKGSNKERFYPPLMGGGHGGRVFLIHDSFGEIVLERRPGKDGVSAFERSSCQKIDPDKFLGMVTPELFKNVYAFSLSELQRFEGLDDDSVRAVIYGASAGLGMSMLPKIQAELERRMGALFKPKGRDQEINRRLKRLEDIRAELHDLAAVSMHFGDREKALKAKEAALSDLNDKLIELKGLDSKIEAYIRLWPDWVRLKELRLELESMSREVPGDFPEDGVAALDRLLERRKERIERAEGRLKEYSALCVEIEGLQVDEAVVSRKDDIDRILRKRDLYRHTKGELDRMRHQRADEAAKIEEMRRAMAAEGWVDIGAVASRKKMADLLSRCIAERRDVEGRLDLLDEVLKDKETSIDGLKRGIDSRKRAIRSALSGVAGLLAAFSLFWSILSIRAARYGEGCLWAVVAVFFTVCGCLAARGGFDKDRSIKEMAARLAGLEDEVAHKAGERDSLKERKARLDEEAERLKAEIGLAGEVVQEDLDGVIEWAERVASRHDALSEAERRLGRLDEAIRQRNEEIKIYSSEIDALFETLGRRLEGDVEDGRALAALDGLCEELRLSSDNCIKRREKEKQLERVCREFLELEGELGMLTMDLDRLIRAGGAADIEGFRRLAGMHQKKIDIVKEINRLEGAIEAASGENIGVLARIFEEKDPARLESEHEDLTAKIRAIEKRMTDENRAIGEIRHDMRDMLAFEDKISVLKAEEEGLVAEIRLLSMKWGSLCLAAYLIKETKREIETDRQPKVVRDASNFFKTITSGAYDKMIIPLEGGVIEAVGSDGARKRPEELSRGTAEQLFLALRLGYILNCAESGVILPIVMDDILVNFDPTRAASAASAILDIAQTHQVLFFTCHPETVSIFKGLAPDTAIYRLGNGRIEPSILCKQPLPA